MCVYGAGHPRQARLQGPVGCAGVPRRQGLHQDSCAHWIARRLLHDASQQQPKTAGTTTCLMPCVATGSIYGTRDAGRAWYEHSKKVLEAAGFVESRLEQGPHYSHGLSGLETVAHTHVDDFLVALQHLVHKLIFETTVGHSRVFWSDHLQG